MDFTWIAMLAALALGALVLGVVANMLRKRTALPAAVRLLPFVLAAVAVLGGVGGTVIGLWTAFGAVGHARPDERATMLARGISEAMNSTAFAIVFAVAFGCGVTAAEIAMRRRR